MKNITKIDLIKENYVYFEFDIERAKKLFKNPLDESLQYRDFNMVLQKQYPEAIIGSGIIDSFIMFYTNDKGKRLDKQYGSYYDLIHKGTKKNNLLQDIYYWFKDKYEFSKEWIDFVDFSENNDDQNIREYVEGSKRKEN
ncbi:hypothetical protein [[Acholeplasma] multilocale]|uniref:hypothetical protein n=1 Tax=[Acholeplasma] multilocale TaxID=264638 RepID=UPI00047CD586|nr:hypothetical protein [[Acholeplasma] multilocale]